MDFDEIFRKCPKWDKEQMIKFGSDLDHYLDHQDMRFVEVCVLLVLLFRNVSFLILVCGIANMKITICRLLL